MPELFTNEKQKFNTNTLLLVSTTHSSDLYGLQRNRIQHIESIDVDLRPYPEKHGQLTSSSSSGNLQKTGMVYERDHEEEIHEYIEKVSAQMQKYIKKHDEDVLRVIITGPAQIKGQLLESLEKHLHNVHINDMHFIEGNYGNIPTTELLPILNSKDL